MLNTKQTRMLRRSGAFDEPETRRMPFKPLWMVIVGIIIIIAGCQVAHAGITDRDAINACIGEAEGETYLGKVMLLYTLHNRNSLKGVYGVKSARVINHRYSQVTYDQCAKAWAFVKTHPNPDWKGTGWGNEADIREFRRHKWFKNCVIIAHVGKHFFYMKKEV